MSFDADVIVVGGGPAGLAAAIGAADAGRSVIVVEPRAGVIDKACGEGLMPGALRALAELGIWEIAGVDFRGIRYRDAVEPRRVADGDFPHHPGRGVRRTALHGALIERAQAVGVQWIEDRVTGVEQSADSVCALGPRARGLVGRYLIAADGLHSSIRRGLGLDAPIHGGVLRYGVRRHYPVTPWIDRVEVHWAADCEAYVTPVAEDAVGVAFLFDRPGRFEALMTRFPLLAERLGDAEPISAARGAGPFRQRAKRVVDGRVLLVGDAAGYLDPLTGEGVAIGLATAAEAIRAIVAGRPARYARGWRRATRRYFALTAGLLRISRSPLRRLVIPVARRLPFVFDGALRLLGGPGPPALPPGQPLPGQRASSHASRAS